MSVFNFSLSGEWVVLHSCGLISVSLITNEVKHIK